MMNVRELKKSYGEGASLVDQITDRVVKYHHRGFRLLVPLTDELIS